MVALEHRSRQMVAVDDGASGARRRRRAIATSSGNVELSTSFAPGWTTSPTRRPRAATSLRRQRHPEKTRAGLLGAPLVLRGPRERERMRAWRRAGRAPGRRRGAPRAARAGLGHPDGDHQLPDWHTVISGLWAHLRRCRATLGVLSSSEFRSVCTPDCTPPFKTPGRYGCVDLSVRSWTCA